MRICAFAVKGFSVWYGVTTGFCGAFRAVMVPAMVMHVIGASGRSGVAFCRSLAADGVPFVPVVRNTRKWQAAGLPGEPVVADVRNGRKLRRALKTADIVVSCVHARHAAAILDASTACHRFVFLGSTRKFTKWPDDHAIGVQTGEDAFRQSDRFGVMLHPTMIYGAQGEDNVQRLARLLKKLPFVPAARRRTLAAAPDLSGRRHPVAAGGGGHRVAPEGIRGDRRGGPG